MKWLGFLDLRRRRHTAEPNETPRQEEGPLLNCPPELADAEKSGDGKSAALARNEVLAYLERKLATAFDQGAQSPDRS